MNANFLFGKETKDWTFDFLAKNIGYEDGRYVLNFNSKRWKFTALFDQTPTNYAYYTRTPYNCTAGDCSLDANLRSQVQAGSADRRSDTTVAQLAGGTVYNSIANPFDLQSRRDTIAAELRFSATDNLDFIVGVNTYKRSGNMPWGASFAFPVGIELPLEIDNRETDWLGGRGVGEPPGDVPLRVPALRSSTRASRPSGGTTRSSRPTSAGPGSPARRRAPATTRAGTPTATGRPTGAWRCRPSNTVDTFNWMGMVKLPARTTANASFSTGTNRQDDALIPWTTNSIDRQRDGVRGVPGAGRAAPRHVRHAA